MSCLMKLGSYYYRPTDPCTGVTSNSAAHGQISKSSPPLPLPPSTFPFLSTPSRHSLHSLPHPYPQLFFPFRLSPPLIAARSLGLRYSSPAGPGRQTHFCATHSAKSANLLKVPSTCTRRPYNMNSCELWLVVNFVQNPDFHRNGKTIFLNSAWQ